MTTHREFRRVAWFHWGRHIARSFAAVGVGVFVFAALWFLLAWIEPAESPEMRAEIAMAVALLVGIVANVAMYRTAMQDARLFCPHCDGSLGLYHTVVVLSSRNCPHCGERVLDD